MHDRLLHRDVFDDRLWASFDWRHALFVLTILTVILFSDVLLSNDGRVLSARGLDLYSGEMSGLDYQYGELRQGRLALWNPHVFSGTSMLSTPLYPFNMVCLFLPLPIAINVIIALHLLMAGFFMYLWTAYRGLHPLACLSAGIMLMFSGPFFMHLYAGHLGNLCAMAWAPLIFLAIDGIMDRPSLRWSLLAIMAVTMQILTSQFQYVYYTAIAVAIYIAVRLVTAVNRRRVLLGLFAIPCGSLLLSAFHLFPVFLTTQEGLRSTGVDIKFAAMFSFPPENLITFLSPFFFGNMQSIPYWGRCYLWEMSLFFTVAGLFLAILGIFPGEKGKSRNSVFMAILLIILAFGAHTPFFNILYQWLPGFDKFRGTSKFSFQAMLFLVMLAGVGLDRIIRKGEGARKLYLIPLGVAVILGSGALWMMNEASMQAGTNAWRHILQFISATGESYLSPKAYQDVQFAGFAGEYAAKGLFIATGTSLILALSCYLIRYSRRAVYLVALLVVLEAFVFASMNRPTFDYKETFIPEFKKYFAAHPGDYRVLKLQNPNTAMSTGSSDIWGYGPTAMGRYVQFMALTQGADPDKATTYLRIHQNHRLFTMLRLRYLFIPGSNGVVIHEVGNPMPRISLLRDWKAAATRGDVFSEMAKPSFDPRKTVILGKKPVPSPVQSDEEGNCMILDTSSDHLTVKADLPSPAILLLTENYSRGWRVRPLKGDSHQSYDIYPANYTLMAIPLDKGAHVFRIEYKPQAFIIGMYISLISLLLYVFCCLGPMIRKFYGKYGPKRQKLNIRRQ